jgi:lysophospholipase L1-like esterase
MNRYLLAFALSFIFASASGQTIRVIAVIGSSTAAGTGAIPIDNSWVNLTKAYYQSLGLIDTIYNIALGGSVTFIGLPTWDSSGEPKPDTAHNVTKALSYIPDVVLVAYASNDVVAGYTLQQTMANLRIIYQEVINAGKIAYVATTQPRGGIPTVQKQLLKSEADSVLAEFPANSMDFYTPLVAADSLSLNPVYAFDSTHPNNAGHQLLFQVVKNTDIFSSFPLALTIGNFSAREQQQDVLLQWTAVEAGAVLFVIQRSQDGISFTGIDQEKEQANLAGTGYSWKDAAPLPGRSYYRLQTTANGSTSFSPIVSIVRSPVDWVIGNVYFQRGGSQLIAEIGSAKNRNITLSVVNTAGSLILRQAGYVAAPASTITLPLFGLAQGEYFLRIVTDDGKVSTKPFLIF